MILLRHNKHDSKCYISLLSPLHTKALSNQNIKLKQIFFYYFISFNYSCHIFQDNNYNLVNYNTIDLISIDQNKQQLFHKQMNNNKQSLVVFKMLLIGSSGVGKSSLLMKYIKNIFSYDYQVTTGVQYFTKTVQINEKTNIKLQIWDTVGQQAYKSVVRSFYKGVSAIILVYSIDKRQTFDQLTSWMKQIREHSHQQTMIYLVGTKLDLQPIRKVQTQEGNNYMKSINAYTFIEVSAKTGQNIKQLFDKVSKGLYKKFQSNSRFKELVQPINTDQHGKSQSFNLKNFTSVQSKSLKKEKNCC